jgi:hypothetical protein
LFFLSAEVHPGLLYSLNPVIGVEHFDYCLDAHAALSLLCFFKNWRRAMSFDLFASVQIRTMSIHSSAERLALRTAWDCFAEGFVLLRLGDSLLFAKRREEAKPPTVRSKGSGEQSPLPRLRLGKPNPP